MDSDRSKELARLGVINVPDIYSVRGSPQLHNIFHVGLHMVYLGLMHKLSSYNYVIQVVINLDIKL